MPATAQSTASIADLEDKLQDLRLRLEGLQRSTDVIDRNVECLFQLVQSSLESGRVVYTRKGPVDIEEWRKGGGC